MKAPFGCSPWIEPVTVGLHRLEEIPMPRRRDRSSERSESSENRHRATRSHHGDQRDEPVAVRDVSLLEELDESLLNDDERAYAEARRIAEAKVRLWGKFWRMAIIVVPLLIFVPWVGILVGIIGGIDLAKRAYKVMYEPRLRERFIDQEVTKRVQQSVHVERASLEGEHARSLEKLSASIAHEIRNPITAAKSLVQQMGEDPSGQDNFEYAQVALQELERVERSISHLLRFAREEEMRATPVRMSDVLDSALATFSERGAREGIEIVRRFDCEGPMLGDAEKLRRVAINLVGNAMDSLSGEGVDKPRVEVSLGENLAGNEVWVRIADNGQGIDPELCEKIFNPFYTSKEHGTGLGLPITKKLVEAHGGTVEVTSSPGQGAEFLLTFPKHTSSGGGLS
jgi:signal transduction histidine kinase